MWNWASTVCHSKSSLRILILSRVDLAVERAVLDERWHGLFTDEESDLDRWRLEVAQGEWKSLEVLNDLTP